MGRRLAIFVGNQSFPADSKFPSLSGPENDVDELSNILADPARGNFENTHSLKNASRIEIISAIRKTLKGCYQEDLLLVFYSGQGAIDDRGRFYLAAADSFMDRLRDTAIRAEDIQEAINDSACGTVVLLLDCCYSGSYGILLAGGFLGYSATPASPFGYTDKDIESKGLFVLTSAASWQLAQEIKDDATGLVMGRFTRELVQRLQSGAFNQDNEIRFSDLAEHIKSQFGDNEVRYFRFNAQGDPLIARLPEYQSIPLQNAPPDIPNLGSGLHIELTDSGLIAFAPPEALDPAGNHVRRLRSLHPELQAAAAELLATLGGGNAPPSVLHRAAADYHSVIALPLDAIDFVRLHARGVRLRNAAAATQEAIRRDAELPLSVEAATALETVLDLHGPFMGGTRDGIELRAEEDDDRASPEQRLDQQRAAVAFAESLAAPGVPTVVMPEVAAELLASAAASGEGPNPARSSVIAAAQVRHVAAAILTMGVATSLSVGVVASAGSGLGVLVALLAVEPIKSSRGYGYVKDFLTKQINRLGDADPQPALDALRRHREFALGHVREFTGLSALGERWDWIGRALDSIRSQPFEPPKPTPERPRPKPRPQPPPEPASA